VLTATRKTAPILIATIGIAGLLSLLLVIEVPGKGLWHEALLNAAHGPIFAVVAVLLCSFLRARGRARSSAYLTAFSVALALGILGLRLEGARSQPFAILGIALAIMGALASGFQWAA
jgi:hypothetical protein